MYIIYFCYVCILFNILLCHAKSSRLVSFLFLLHSWMKLIANCVYYESERLTECANATERVSLCMWEATHDFTVNFDYGKEILVALLDLSAAFDIIDHEKTVFYISWQILRLWCAKFDKIIFIWTTGQCPWPFACISCREFQLCEYMTYKLLTWHHMT